MIVITTPTGTIGAAVAQSLLAEPLAQRTPLRLIARDATRLPRTLRDHADVVTGSHADPAVLDTALDGADALFVLVPPNFRALDVTDHYLDFARPIAAAVRAHGIRRLVAVSSLGRGFAGPAGQLSAAWAMDEVLEASGAAYRSLQPPFFMENLLHQLASIRERGSFALPADLDQAHPVVATADIARAAAALLVDATWTGQEGVVVREPVDHTPREMAEVMSQVLDRPIACERASLEDYREQFASAGASTAVADAMVEMAQAQQAGVYPPVTPGGGTTFADWCGSVLKPALAT